MILKSYEGFRKQWSFNPCEGGILLNDGARGSPGSQVIMHKSRTPSEPLKLEVATYTPLAT